MTAYSVVVSKHATLVASTEDTVTLAQDAPRVEIINRGSVDIYVRVDGQTVVLGADDTEIVPASSTLVVETPGTQTVVRLISSSATPYSVVVRP